MLTAMALPIVIASARQRYAIATTLIPMCTRVLTKIVIRQISTVTPCQARVRATPSVTKARAISAATTPSFLAKPARFAKPRHWVGCVCRRIATKVARLVQLVQTVNACRAAMASPARLANCAATARAKMRAKAWHALAAKFATTANAYCHALASRVT